MSKNSFNAKSTLSAAGKDYEIFDITGLDGADTLPFSLKVLLKNLPPFFVPVLRRQF